MNKISSLKISLVAPIVAIGLLFISVSGCSGQDDRHPDAASIKAADTKRQAYIDGLNISPEAKAQMKAHMGGPPASNPAEDAAKNGAAGGAPITTGARPSSKPGGN